jgi:hypothetical protein
LQQRDAPLGSVKKNSECERSNTAIVPRLILIY